MTWQAHVRRVVLIVVDVAAWTAGLFAASALRFGFELTSEITRDLLVAVAIAATSQTVFGLGLGLYRGRARLASFEEAGLLGFTVGATTILLAAVAIAPRTHLVPVSSLLAAAGFALTGTFTARYLARMLRERRSLAPVANRRRMLVFGAGEAGEQAVRALLRDPQAEMSPVAVLDDDPAKRSLRIAGLRVVGTRRDIAAAAQRLGAEVLLIAMPSAPHSEIVAVADIAQAAGLSVKILPSIADIAAQGVQVRDMRDITLADFLSRPEIRLDDDKIGHYLTGKRVLVTGAGGSIGSQLCESITGFGPANLIMLDHSENNLHRLGMRLFGSAAEDRPELCLADIRDKQAVLDTFERWQPQVVFHAAAHKHVPLLELQPTEGIKTNVYGTLNVLEAASRIGVERLVNISTDKAADPVNVLGMTKRLAEQLTAHMSARAEGVFLSVRFGNVLGSDGSVIPTFREQLTQGLPLTVTDPDVTRYFMTIPEAVQLVLQAGAIGEDGDVLVLEMGEPVKIVDLAKRVAAELKPGVPATIKFTGLRPGEKLHEVLFSSEDTMVDKPHDMLWRCKVPPFDPAKLNGARTLSDLRDLLASTLSFT